MPNLNKSSTLVFLFFILSMKIEYEERELRKSFPEYKSYVKDTIKLIPKIY